MNLFNTWASVIILITQPTSLTRVWRQQVASVDLDHSYLIGMMNATVVSKVIVATVATISQFLLLNSVPAVASVFIVGTLLSNSDPGSCRLPNS